MEKATEVYQNFTEQKTMVKIIDLYGNCLMRFINCYINDIYQSEDLMMEVFVELLVRKPLFDNEFKFRAYLYRTAKNKAINYLHQRKKLVVLNEETLQEITIMENALYRSELDKTLRNALQKINLKYRQVIDLSYFEGMKNSQIAQILNLNEKAVINLKHRAKQKLNRILSQDNLIFKFKEDL